MADKIYDVVIIGSGPAGMTAAIYCIRKGLDTLIIGKEVGGQVAKSAEIENYLGFGSSTGQELSKEFHEHVKSFENIEHVHDVLVKKIEQKDDKFTAITDENKYEAKSLIIASGRKPRKLGIPGEEEFRNKGVSYCETCDAPLFKDKKTAVIGGGNSGLEAVMSLVDICPKVYLLEYAKELNADKVLQDKIKELDNVEIITNAETTEILGDKFVTGLKYKDRESKEEKEIELKGIFIEIGWKPSIDFDKISPKNDKNEIIVDKKCRTEINGLFAAGDITDIGYWQIIIAAGEGAKAALSAYDYISKNK
jgi:alkyl hydroperoxide reductase subunit F